MTEPKCAAADEWFDLRCGAPATMIATDGEREGFVCAEDAARAALGGWSVRDLPVEVRR